jgi:hypothetical protein
MSKFDELCGVYGKSRDDYFVYEEESFKFASSLVINFVEYFGIPQVQIKFIPTNIEPEEGLTYTLPGSIHLDTDTFWHLGMIVTLYEEPIIFPHQPIKLVLKFKKENTQFLVKLQNTEKEFRITPFVKLEYNDFYDHIYEEIKNMFKDQLQQFLKDSSTVKTIGFHI